MSCSWWRRRGKLAADASFAEHEDAVAETEELGEFAGDEDDGLPSIGELIN
jgi:hypothetical protein